MTGSLHLVTGEDSGSDSSLFCRPLIEYFKSLTNLDLNIVDLEQSLLIGKTYAPEHYSVLTANQIGGETNIFEDDLASKIPTIVLSALPEDLSKTDLMFDLAAQGKTLIVNLPPGSCETVYKWLQLGQLLPLSKKLGVKIWQWFVTNGSAESILKLKQSYQFYGDFINYVIIRNQGSIKQPGDWKIFKSDQGLQNYLRKSQSTYVIEMPRFFLSKRRWETIKQNCLTLEQAYERHRPALTIMEKHYVFIWRKQIFEALDSVPLCHRFNEFNDNCPFF